MHFPRLRGDDERTAVAHLHRRLQDARRNLAREVASLGSEHPIGDERRATVEQATLNLATVLRALRQEPPARRAKSTDRRTPVQRLVDAHLFLQHRLARRKYRQALDRWGSSTPQAYVAFAAENEAWNALQGHREEVLLEAAVVPENSAEPHDA